MLKKKKKRKIHVSSHNSRGISRATTEKGGGGRTDERGRRRLAWLRGWLNQKRPRDAQVSLSCLLADWTRARVHHVYACTRVSCQVKMATPLRNGCTFFVDKAPPYLWNVCVGDRGLREMAWKGLVTGGGTERRGVKRSWISPLVTSRNEGRSRSCLRTPASFRTGHGHSTLCSYPR